MTNAQNLKAFNAAFDTLRQVSYKGLPWIGGTAAEFYAAPAGDGWMVLREVSASGVERDTTRRVSKRVIDSADAVEFDPYNDAACAMAYITIAESELEA